MTAIGAKATGAGASSRAAQMWDQANWSHMEGKRLGTTVSQC
ncbi:hypothetical protein B0G71_7911 [Paraburkholderia sp. BL27I4N3]|nr:hypothetical protein B0G71_7911 [Paraburkholderia sp. BL27I4N3]